MLKKYYDSMINKTKWEIPSITGLTTTAALDDIGMLQTRYAKLLIK